MADQPVDLTLRSRPQAYMRPTWVFELDKHDSLIMLKALGGRLTEEEIPLAEELGDRLTELRAKSASQYLASLERAVDGMMRARESS